MPDETYVSRIETVCFVTFGTFCGSRRLVLRVFRLFRWFRFGCSGSFGGSGGSGGLVPADSFRCFSF